MTSTTGIGPGFALARFKQTAAGYRMRAMCLLKILQICKPMPIDRSGRAT